MLTLSAGNDHVSRSAKIGAVVCLAAVLAVAGIQAMHMHSPGPDGSLDSHCSLCLVSHFVPHPQQAYVVALPVRVVHRPGVARTPEVLQPRIFRSFVRPPPSA